MINIPIFLEVYTSIFGVSELSDLFFEIFWGSWIFISSYLWSCPGEVPVTNATCLNEAHKSGVFWTQVRESLPERYASWSRTRLPQARIKDQFGAKNWSTVDGFTWLHCGFTWTIYIRSSLYSNGHIFGEPSTGTRSPVTCLSMTRGLSCLMHGLLHISWIICIMFQGFPGYV